MENKDIIMSEKYIFFKNGNMHKMIEKKSDILYNGKILVCVILFKCRKYIMQCKIIKA